MPELNCGSEMVDPDMESLTKRLHLTKRVAPFGYCGRDFDYAPGYIRITQQSMAESLDRIEPDRLRLLCEVAALVFATHCVAVER